MKIATRIFLLLLMCIIGCKRSDWITFRSHEGGFSIQSPSVLNQQIVSMESFIGPIEFTLFMLEEEKFVYLVGYSDYPDSIIFGKTAKELLKYAASGAIANLKGTLLKESPISLGKNPGWQVSIKEEQTNREYQIHLYLVGNRLYQLTTLAPQKAPFQQNAKRLVDSFTLLDQ